MNRSFPAIVGVLLMLATSLVTLPASVANAAVNRDAVLDLTFPVAGSSTFSDTYTANRDGGSRRHQATDIFGVKGQAIHAAVGGTVCFAPGIGEPMPAYGYMVRICNDGITYSYIHLNNDSPGTDDGRASSAGAYAPGIRNGVTVQRGQLIGYMGDSGNAEDTPTHLHFDIFDRSMTDPDLASAPWRQHYRNPAPSLRAARARGDIASSGTSGSLRIGSMGAAVQDWQEHLNSVAGAGLVADGAFGPATDTATKAFQRAHDLTADGIVGPATLAAMAAADGSGVTPVSLVNSPAGGSNFPGRLLRSESPLMRGDDVRAWQGRMAQRGWRGADGRPLVVDGIFGPDSDRAARLFQKEKGLTVDGVIGPTTWSTAFAT